MRWRQKLGSTTSRSPHPARIFFTDAARTDLKHFPHLVARFQSRIQTLGGRPDRGHPLSGALAGTRSLELTQQGGGFRAVYRWNREGAYVLIFAIGPHATVYQTATERYPPPELAGGEQG